MKETIEQLDRKMEALLQNAKLQMEKGNKAAGLRARRISLDIEPLLKQFRKQSLAASQVKE
ncbi:histone H1 [Bacteroides faecis]|uniref:Histone H1 n=1 Tax=Bacteroides faecis TaxID=674529 RepID=A0AAW5NZ26_9BACE|nr:histone H1 [Bacteroides faecis]MCS2793819.1 histone H1 [Bacteroides faecis]